MLAVAESELESATRAARTAEAELRYTVRAVKLAEAEMKSAQAAEKYAATKVEELKAGRRAFKKGRSPGNYLDKMGLPKLGSGFSLPASGSLSRETSSPHSTESSFTRRAVQSVWNLRTKTQPSTPASMSSSPNVGGGRIVIEGERASSPSSVKPRMNEAWRRGSFDDSFNVPDEESSKPVRVSAGQSLDAVYDGSFNSSNGSFNSLNGSFHKTGRRVLTPEQQQAKVDEIRAKVQRHALEGPKEGNLVDPTRPQEEGACCVQ